MIPMSFDQPSWLALAPLALGLVWLGRRRGLGPRARTRTGQQRAADWVRAAAVACLILALAGPRWQRAGTDVDVAFLVDASDSVGRAGQLTALEYVAQALETRRDADRAALALFGRDARLEYTLRSDPPSAAQAATVVDGSATDLSRALRLAQGVLGSEHRRRIVLLSDGRQTQGDLEAAAAELAATGVSVDVVRLEGGTADVLVEQVIAPSRVREGESYDVTGVLRNTGAVSAEAVVEILADGERIERREVTLDPGTTEVTVEQTAQESRTVRYEVRLRSGASTTEENDAARAAVQVEGPAKVLVLEGGEGLGEDLSRALESGSIPVERRQAGAGPGLPPLDELLDYDAVVLVDVPALQLGEGGMQTLDAFVRDAGHGLIAIGGESSFGMGEYDGTPLEELLPVFAQITDPKRRPPIAQALVVDSSGSMDACHCADENFGGGGDPMIEGGVKKTDIAKEAIVRAVSALESQDQVGVLVFNTQSEWVLPLQSLPADDVLDGALARIHPVGDTNIPQAVREAIAGLRDADARLRHIVLFTDGFTSNTHGFADVAQEAADAGITLSVVGTGEGAFPELRQMAATGGGRYYPGRDLASIPDIIALEVRFAARPIITEGRFLPTVTGIAAATEDLDASPPLLGYLATTAKPTAQTLLVIGDERDPLLATWRAGLGTTTAWTSDASPRWSAQWVTWDRFSRFWSDVVKGTFPVEPDPRFALSASATSDGVHVRLETDGLEGAPADVDAVAVITSPGGEREEVQLDRTSLTSFEATVPAGATDAAEGVYAVSARLSQGDEDLYHGTVTAIRAYSPEYGAIEADPELLARAVEAAGGRLDPEPATIFDPAGLSPGVSARELWAGLALLALILLPIDIGLRRLQLERADWARAKAWVRARARGGVRAGRAAAPAQRSAASDALFAAKARARGAPDQRAGDADQRAGSDADQRAGDESARDRSTGAPPPRSRPPAAAPSSARVPAAAQPPARGPETSAPGLVPPPPGLQSPPAPASETASSSAPEAPAERGMAALRAAKARARAEAERRSRGDRSDERPPGD